MHHGSHFHRSGWHSRRIHEVELEGRRERHREDGARVVKRQGYPRLEIVREEPVRGAVGPLAVVQNSLLGRIPHAHANDVEHLRRNCKVHPVRDVLIARVHAHAVERALELHADTDRWQSLVRRVMQEDWSWDASARKYLRLYQHALASPPTPVRVP